MAIHMRQIVLLLVAIILSALVLEVVSEEVTESDDKLISSNSKMYLCLNNCALCVRQWETGLYNGEKCAKKCLKFKANPRVIDPDCNNIKFFNYKFIKRKNKRN